MHKSFEAVCTALDHLASAAFNGWADDRTMCEAWGWNFPAVTRHDLARMPLRLSESIRQVAPERVDDELDEVLKTLPAKLQVMQRTIVPNLYNGNGSQAGPVYITSLEAIASALQPVIGWQVMQDSKAMPASVARRIRSYQAQLDEIAPDKAALQTQIKLIQEATAAAETLPTDLQTLKEARNRVDRLSTESAELFGKIDTHYKQAEKLTTAIDAQKQEADKLVHQCEEAYRITTTTGLAAAFDQRAKRLATSVWIWVSGLLIALGLGAFIGSERIRVLSTALNASTPQWGVIWVQIVLSLISVGAPLWFAWLATKQIGQRFRLSEDYAFKASVAKAYEGYRREAARIDEAFEARLFSSALSRLEEAPLRLIEPDTHGSPWHELVSSSAFQKAMNNVPELRDKFIDLAKAGISRVNGAKTPENKLLVE